MRDAQCMVWVNECWFFSKSVVKEYVAKYHGQKLGSLEPHIFALAEAAYRHLRDNSQNQVGFTKLCTTLLSAKC